MKTVTRIFAIVLVLGLVFGFAPMTGVRADSVIELGSGVATSIGADAVSADHYTGAGAWSANGNTMEFYLAPETLGLSTILVDDIDSVVYHTKDGTSGGVDWGFYIYTKGLKYGWYEERLVFEPLYSISYNGAPADTWNTWNSAAGTNQIAFYDDHYTSMGFYYGPTLANIQAGPIDWSTYDLGEPATSIDYGAQEVLTFKFGTGSAWSSTFFGLLDTIELTISGDKYIIDLEDLHPVTYVDDSWVGTTFGTDPDGAGPAKIFGDDAFATVEEGVAAVSAGGTVNVAEGTYNPSTKITLSKAITISGPTTGEAKVIGVGGLNLTVFEITSSDVTIQNLTLTLANPPLAHIGIIHAPDGEKTNINITGNTIFVDPQAGAMSTWWGQAVYLGRYTTGSNVTDNLIYNMRGGVVVAYNSALAISDNVIYNTKGGIMNYTGSVADADARVITGNSWNDVHNEWDIVWNSGGGPYVMDMDKYVLQLSKANTDAHVVSLMTTGVLAELTGNRSHVYVDDSGTTTLKADNGNVNVPYAKIQDGINAVVPGGTVYVAAGTYNQALTIN